MALERYARSTAAVEIEDLAMITNAHADGPGSIAVGGDAINNIFVTGGVNHFFVGQYERLAAAYLNPRSLSLQLRLDEYGGRSWCVEKGRDMGVPQ